MAVGKVRKILFLVSSSAVWSFRGVETPPSSKMRFPGNISDAHGHSAALVSASVALITTITTVRIECKWTSNDEDDSVVDVFSSKRAPWIKTARSDRHSSEVKCIFLDRILMVLLLVVLILLLCLVGRKQHRPVITSKD